MSPEAMRQGFAEALELAAEGHTLADLEQDLADRNALLWTGENCAIVTNLQEGPGGRFLHVWLGTGDLSEMAALEPGIAAHARALGCKYASINGRKGWDRVFSKNGFTRDGDELRKLL